MDLLFRGRLKFLTSFSSASEPPILKERFMEDWYMLLPLDFRVFIDNYIGINLYNFITQINLSSPLN